MFAQRILSNGGDSVETKIDYAFQRAVARKPEHAESEVLQRLFQQQFEIFSQNSDAAMKIVSVGESPVPSDFDQTEHAAWTAIASIILNLDETVTRE